MNSDLKFILPLIFGSGLCSGLVSAFLGTYLTRKKYKAEVSNLQLINEKLGLEIVVIKNTLENKTSEITASLNYYQSTTKENTIYKSEGKDMGFSFKGRSGHAILMINGIEVASKESGTGTIAFDQNILNIERTNIEGRFELWLETYLLNEKNQDFIPKDILSGNKKKFKLSFSAKINDEVHQLTFTFKGIEKGIVLARTQITVETKYWKAYTLYFTVDPTENCRLRIDDYNLSTKPSSIQIKDIVLVENRNQ